MSKYRGLSRRKVCAMLLALPIAARARAEEKNVIATESELRLENREVNYRFTRQGSGWAFDSVWVRGRKTAIALERKDSFWLGGGEAAEYEVTPDKSEVRFRGFVGRPDAVVSFRTAGNARLPMIAIALTGVAVPTVAWRTPGTSKQQRGAWVTRGETATDAEEREVFIDGSGRLVFGHSWVGPDADESSTIAADSAYVIQAEINENINPRGRSMQPSSTFFKSGRGSAGNDGYFGYWQIRMGADQPKQFNIVFDRDLGGRMHHVCEKYYAAAVDSQIDMTSVSASFNPPQFDPSIALETMPLRLSCPESLISGYGWHMEEYPRAAYPYGQDSAIETGALLAFEGLATGREWERNFGKYVLDQTPIWGETDNAGYFTQRPGGWTRWCYTSDYRQKFPEQGGGAWGSSEQLYQVALEFGDEELKQRALGLMKHDVLVKLDLEAMYFAPGWDPLTNAPQPEHDAWNKTGGLGYCAEVSSEILYRETGDQKYLQIADRITNWMRGSWGPELRMNFLQPGVNTFHCWMGWLPRAMVHRYERSGDPVFLDIAMDLAWVMILAVCVTPSIDSNGQSLTGVTCVGVRDCVDYDCTPNLCQEKDLPFLEMMGPILDHAGGAAYAKYLALQKHVLPRDRWLAAFGIQEQCGVNLRTNYDNYPRAMTNLAFSLNCCDDPHITVFEKNVSKRNLEIDRKRDVVIANATGIRRKAEVQVRFLKPSRYQVRLDGRNLGLRSHAELARGITVVVPGNATRSLVVELLSLSDATSAPVPATSAVYLSDLTEQAAQRGVGMPMPVYRRDHTFRGNSIMMDGHAYSKGLGLTANTVLVYALDGKYRRLTALAGVAADAQSVEGPEAAINVTIFVDGHCRFSSGGMRAKTPAQQVDVDLTYGRTLVIRISGNWEDHGDLRNAMGNLADARLLI